jgi:uncharacterized protein
MKISFGWEENKNEINIQKHKVDFEEAETVFFDPLALIFDDDAHSSNEIRELIIGHSIKNRILIISFTERSDRIRIISARLITKKERKDYEENS